MSDETEKKPEEEKKSEDDKPEDKEKHSDSANISESNKALIDVLSKVGDALVKNTETLAKMEGKIDKALEEPTNLPLKPSVSASDDIGDKVKVPDTYQSNSQQASIDDSDPKNEPEKDPGELKMQEKKKAVKLEKTSVGRPSTVKESPEAVEQITSGVSYIEKAYAGSDKNPVLDDFRKLGLENSNTIRAKILKGDYFMPTDTEVSHW